MESREINNTRKVISAIYSEYGSSRYLRLARLFVNRENSGVVNVVTSNVASFSINTSQYPFSSIQLDGISLSNLSGGTVRFETVEPRTKMWRVRTAKHCQVLETDPVARL